MRFLNVKTMQHWICDKYTVTICCSLCLIGIRHWLNRRHEGSAIMKSKHLDLTLVLSCRIGHNQLKYFFSQGGFLWLDVGLFTLMCVKVVIFLFSWVFDARLCKLLSKQSGSSTCKGASHCTVLLQAGRYVGGNSIPPFCCSHSLARNDATGRKCSYCGLIPGGRANLSSVSMQVSCIREQCAHFGELKGKLFTIQVFSN